MWPPVVGVNTAAFKLGLSASDYWCVLLIALLHGFLLKMILVTPWCFVHTNTTAQFLLLDALPVLAKHFPLPLLFHAWVSKVGTVNAAKTYSGFMKCMYCVLLG